ncbi:LysR substrate-binding domain-containing protein [Streptomyces sp. NPDC060020]|uniref:LysR substrate-binding domain-containing protein n=1 Tax=Streptomyces sp. NPDC060020 TaxID=3347038 RepID=UPI0036968935
MELLTIAGDLPPYRREAHSPARTPAGRPIRHGPEVTNMQEALMLVAAGRGALLTAAHTAVYHARPGVSYVPFTDAEPVGYGLVWRAADNSGAVRAFARAALAAAGANPGPPAGQGPGPAGAPS